MLSIIISSYQPEYFSALEKNIAETMGIPYEIIKVDNPGKMGICKAYNLGAKQAQYDFLLFLHEDVLFENIQWGTKLIKILKSENCGAVGVAGSTYHGFIPASWWSYGRTRINIIQADKNSNQKLYILRVNFFEDNEREKVQSLDGVFLACRKDVYEKFPFDEILPGYHGYDVLFSLKIAKHFQNYVTDQILITHFSRGSLSKQWLEAIIKVNKILGGRPVIAYDRETEFKSFYNLLNSFKEFNFSKKEIILTVFYFLNTNILGLKNCLKILNRTRYLFK